MLVKYVNLTTRCMSYTDSVTLHAPWLLSDKVVHSPHLVLCNKPPFRKFTDTVSFASEAMESLLGIGKEWYVIHYFFSNQHRTHSLHFGDIKKLIDNTIEGDLIAILYNPNLRTYFLNTATKHLLKVTLTTNLVWELSNRKWDPKTGGPKEWNLLIPET